MSAHPIEQVLAALNAAEVRYLIAGGVAVVLHGHLRTTADLDLVVALDHANASRAILALQSLGFRPRAPVPADQFAGLEVDRFVKEPFDFEQGYARAVVVQLDSTSARVVSLDDLLAMKRAAGRPLDGADVEALEAIRRKERP
jgi:hypothetical protein